MSIYKEMVKVRNYVEGITIKEVTNLKFHVFNSSYYTEKHYSFIVKTSTLKYITIQIITSFDSEYGINRYVLEVIQTIDFKSKTISKELHRNEVNSFDIVNILHEKFGLPKK